MLFSHGIGCDQRIWRHVAPAFTRSHQVVLFDHVGSGKSNRDAYRHAKYQSLQGYADDIVELLTVLDLQDVVFIGHSVAAMIGLLAAINAPQRFAALVMLGPSPRYIEDGDYHGGFTRSDVTELLQTMTLNYEGWARQMAPMVVDHTCPGIADELANTFVQTDPVIMRHFAEVTFLTDVRASLPLCPVPSLVLQSRNDVIVPLSVGEYLHQHLPDCSYRLMQAMGHYPHLSAPDEVIGAIQGYVRELSMEVAR